jgi:hypothetical protein
VNYANGVPIDTCKENFSSMIKGLHDSIAEDRPSIKFFKIKVPTAKANDLEEMLEDTLTALENKSRYVKKY